MRKAEIPLDVITTILCGLPTKSVGRCKLVCRHWAKLISDPIFASLHTEANPTAPLAAFYLDRHTKNCSISLMGSCPAAFASPRFLPHRFKPVASCHGLVCYSDDNDLVICNPVTQDWAALSQLWPRQPPPLHDSSFGGLVLIDYDPAVSLHYKLVKVMFSKSYRNNGRRELSIYFHIFSSKTWSWRVSAEFQLSGCEPCRFFGVNLGGGTICWWDGEYFLKAYDIANESFWEVPLPDWKSWLERISSSAMLGYEGQVYLIIRLKTEVIVWRMDGERKWHREGKRCINRKLCRWLSPLTYDPVRQVVVLQHQWTGNLMTWNLRNSRLEVLCKCSGWSDVDWFKDPVVLAHRNTFASFHIDGGDEARSKSRRLIR